VAESAARTTLDAPVPSSRSAAAPSAAATTLARLSLAFRLVCAVSLVGLFVWQSFYDHAADFKSFYSAGYAVRHPDIPLYDLVALDENPFGELFKLAPPAAVYLVPFSFGTVQQARLAWRITLVIMIVAAYAVLAHTIQFGAVSWPGLAGFGLWTQFGPLQIAVGEGQWDPVFLLLIAVATFGVASQRWILTALMIALAASIKPYPMALAGWFLAHRQWRAILVTGLAAVVLFSVGALIVGLEETTAFLTRVLPASGSTTAYADNQTLAGLLARLVSADLKPFPLHDAPTLDLAIRALALVLSGLTVWIVARRPAASPFERAVQLSLFVPLSILVIPAAWTHYEAILLVPLTLLAVDQARHRPRNLLGWAMLAAIYVVLLLPNPTMLYGPEIDRGLWLRSRADAANLALQRLYPTEVSRLILSYKVFGIAALYGLLAWRISRPAGHTEPNASSAPLPALMGSTR
jgi:alpha-1,2-mannosyltransferase